MAAETLVETYSFRPNDLSPETRRPGISAFMRIKNGADFLETTIRSHIEHFDEIVAVYNQCTDTTPDILARLAGEYGERLRVFHYLPSVYPPGGEGHAKEPADSPRSLVNYYNFALTRTGFSVATKLDDDHLAMQSETATLTRRARQDMRPNEMFCFSGLNLARTADGNIGILANEPFSGSGDIGLFPVTRDTYFAHDSRFERFRRDHLRRTFAGVVYWHLKYLKPGLGFENYELTDNPNSRYARRLATFPTSPRLVTPSELGALARPIERLSVAVRSLGLPLPEKQRLLADRIKAAHAMSAISIPPNLALQAQ